MSQPFTSKEVLARYTFAARLKQKLGNKKVQVLHIDRLNSLYTQYEAAKKKGWSLDNWLATVTI